tara:strand:- start:56 stop:853 length:798 start_codon:yes stop_codon:yes gene_type:complete
VSTLSTTNQILNLIKNENFTGKTVLEIGYHEDENVPSIKNFCTKRGANFFRTNFDADKDIDFVWDLHKKLPVSSPHSLFDFIICSSVMEHVAKPWIAAKNIENIINKRGTLIWTTPWVWRIHGYPSDFWRFTPNGIKELFSKLSWQWIGFEMLLNGSFNNKSVLVDWNDDMKDPAMVIYKLYTALEKLKVKGQKMKEDGRPSNQEKDIETIKKRIVASSTEKNSPLDCKTYRTSRTEDFIYESAVNSQSIVLLPMSNFFMIGEKV